MEAAIIWARVGNEVQLDGISTPLGRRSRRSIHRKIINVIMSDAIETRFVEESMTLDGINAVGVVVCGRKIGGLVVVNSAMTIPFQDGHNPIELDQILLRCVGVVIIICGIHRTMEDITRKDFSSVLSRNRPTKEKRNQQRKPQHSKTEEGENEKKKSKTKKTKKVFFSKVVHPAHPKMY